MNSDRLWKLQHRWAPYLFVAPFVVLFAVFMVYPLGRSFIMSFYQSAGPRTERFVGLANYKFLLTDLLFWLAVANTIGYTLAFVAIQIPLSLGLAVLLNSSRVRCRGFFRFACFSTYMVGQVFVAVIFAMILSPRAGLLNRFLGLFCRQTPDVDWLGNPALAMPSVLMAGVWLSVGFGMVYFLAALQSVPRELYEAAQVDGASKWDQFWHITLPGIKPVLLFLVLVDIIAGLQLFELPFVLYNGGGPNLRALTIVMYLYICGFEAGNLGYAAAIGWVLVLLVMGVAIAQTRLTRLAGESQA